MCKTCSDLQLDIELAARDFSRAVADSRTALHEVSNDGAPSLLVEAERRLRMATAILKMHQDHCDQHHKKAS